MEMDGDTHSPVHSKKDGGRHDVKLHVVRQIPRPIKTLK